MFTARIKNDASGLELGSEWHRRAFKDFLKKNVGARVRIELMLPESRKQRAFYFGAVLPLWAYLDGKEYRDSSVLAQIHETAKLEFNGEIFVVNKKSYRVGKSTRGKLATGFIDRVIDYLEESYGIKRGDVLNTELYKKFRDEIYPFTTEYNTFIDYMVSLKLLTV